MVKRSALVMTCAVAAISGLSAQSAFAGTVAVDTDAQTGVKRVLFGESRVNASPSRLMSASRAFACAAPALDVMELRVPSS